MRSLSQQMSKQGISPRQEAFVVYDAVSNATHHMHYSILDPMAGQAHTQNGAIPLSCTPRLYHTVRDLKLIAGVLLQPDALAAEPVCGRAKADAVWGFHGPCAPRLPQGTSFSPREDRLNPAAGTYIFIRCRLFHTHLVFKPRTLHDL